ILKAKKERYDIKQQRLYLAQDEFNHLQSALTTLNTSRTSLCSSTSSVSTKYDPDLLKSDVALARNRVSRIKRELEQIRAEMNCTQRGVETLASVEQKLNSHQGGCYNITEAQAIMTELRNIQKSLSSGEKEKAELMQSLAKLKDDLTRLQLCESSPDVSTLSLPQEKLSTASQTDLSGELVPIGTRLAEMARMRLQYDEARKRIQMVQQQLADLEEKVTPGQAESDKDRIIIIIRYQKEQLLRELRSITPRTRSQQEMQDIQQEIRRLEQDLNNALEMSNRAITDRLRLHEEKQLLLQQLRDALRSMTQLESQLKTLSASTLSVSSSSSLGSLSTTSSKGSLSSGLSFTDIYGGPQCLGLSNVSVAAEKPIDMVDLHRRVERLLRSGSSESSNLLPSPSSGRSQPSLSPRSSLSSCFDKFQLEDHLSERAFNHQNFAAHLQQHDFAMSGGVNGKTPPPMLDDSVELQVAALSTPSSSGTNTRSVSAAVSDESVAGDSGVFEASNKKRSPLAGDGMPEIDDLNLETPQVQIKLSHQMARSLLHIGIERARNLIALFVPEHCKIYLKVALLPNPPPVNGLFCTKAVEDLRKPTFGDNFPLAVPLNKLYTKTLQVNAWCVGQDDHEDCVGSAQVSLADFRPESVSVKWYNILSFRFMDPGITSPDESEVSAVNKHVVAVKEESSDESTIISSQTSTLTRNQEDILEEVLEHAVDDCSEDTAVMTDSMIEFATDTQDKETNTECVFIPEKGVRKRGSGEEPSRAIVIKRSQTFSPSAAVSRNQYICRLNRSDSDSSMPLYRRGGPFQRNSIERRSLRWRRPPGTVLMTKHHRSSSSGAAGSHHNARTSLDLELDLQAQHTKLLTLQDDLARLRELKSRLETARAQGDQELAAWVLEDQQFQNLVAQVEIGKNGKSPDERKVEKMLKKTSKEIYKLRKSKAGKGKPDVISFKEKMAFFTRVNMTVPVLPTSSALEDGASSECSTLKHSEESGVAGNKLGDKESADKTQKGNINRKEEGIKLAKAWYHTLENKCINTRDNKETTISQSARATPTHPAATTNTTSAAFTLTSFSIRSTFRSEKDLIEKEAKLLKQIEKPKELTVWEKIYIQKSEKKKLMNFEITGENDLVSRFFSQPMEGAKDSSSR
ncbi:hypothetical protein L9F63_000796, partial [Diploptera punctata]